MGIKMETASQFLRTSTKLLSKFKADKKTENDDAMLGMSPLSWDSKEKENAYVIKVEDNEKLYRPLFKQFDDIPKISYNETGSPFDVGVVLVKQSDNNQSAKKKPAGRVLKGGYCESCDHWYRCTLREHLSSNKHKEFVGKIDNFKNLEMVSDDLPSFSEFLKHNKQNPLYKSCENTKTYLSNDSNNNKINCQPEEVKEGLFDHPESGHKISKQYVGKPEIVDGSTIETFTQGNNSNCVRSEVNDLMENVGCTRTDSRGNSNQNCISTKRECHTSSNSSTTHLVTNMTRDSVGLENDDSESYHDTCNGMNRLNHQSHSYKTDIEGSYGVPEVAPVYRANISEANFSSSSCSFGDNGVRNALSILQTNISDNSNSSHGRLSADIFFKNVNGLECQGNTIEDVIEKSEISLVSVVSGNNENALHTPTFDKFLKGRDNVVNETEEMPVLFRVEDLSESDIENGMTHMPVIDKHTPPSQMQKQSVNDIGLALEGISDTTQKELIIKNSPFHEPCKLPSDLSLNSLRDSNKTGTVDFETVLHTPKSKFGNKLAEEFNEKVQNSGSTITSVRNWLLPNGDKDSVYSAVSAAKINDTLVASKDVGVDEEKELEQLTESEQKQQNLVANWIQTQEFGTSSENPSAALSDTDINVLQNLETPNKESELQDNLSSRDITTPISEMYNDQYTDLSSIPTDSYISDREYAQSLEGFSVTKLDTTDKMIENIDGKNQTETSNKENDICDYNSISNFADKSVNSHPSTLEASDMNKLQFPEDNKSICNITAASSIDLASGSVCIGSKQKIHTDTSETLNNSENVLIDMCTVGNAGLSQNTVVNNNIQCSKEADKISTETTNLNKVNNKETKGKKKPVKPKARKARTTKGKSIDSIEKCNTPVSNISCNSASSLPNSAVGTFSAANSYLIQQQGYSPISQSSDNFSQHQFNSSYNMNRVQSPNQSYQQMSGNTCQQFYGQSGVSQGHYNQGQSYYDTGLLPGHNFYSEERHAFYQNNCNMQSQHYGFSGITDCNGFASQFQQQFSNNVINYSQGGYNGAHIYGSVHMNNMNNVNINSNNFVQNVQDFRQVDFLDNSGFSQGASQNTSCVSSPGSFYPAQTLPVQNSPSVPIHVSSHSSQQFSQEFSPVQSNYHVSPQVNHQYSQSQQLYQDSQQTSSQFPQFYQNQHSPAHQVIQEQSQGNQWYLSSPGYTNTSQSLGQVQESARTYETISLNDIAEENCHASQMSFTFGRLKSKENQNLDSVSTNRNSAAAKKGRRKTVAEVQMNKTDANAKTVCHSLNTSNVGYTASNAIGNGVPPSVQPLKPSFPMTTDLQQANYSNFDSGVHQVRNENSSFSDKSYMSAKVGDTKIKISKVGNSAAAHGGKKTDLKDYWNVKKTGDCRLVFRASKRKAEDEEMPVGSSFTPYHESPVQEQRYGGLHEAKRRRCLVY